MLAYDREVMHQVARCYELGEGLPFDHPLRTVPYAAAEALREGPDVTLAGWLKEHQGQEVAALELNGATVQAHRANELVFWATAFSTGEMGRLLDQTLVLGAATDPDTVVFQDRRGIIVTLMVADGPLCHQDNPWCDYSEEPVDERHAEWGPYHTICLVHHGQALPEREEA